MNLAPGTRLGPYEIVAPIGKGGMGEVYRGTDTRLGRSVAIKVVAKDVSSDPRYRKRLEHEAKAISRLQHANVCTLHDIGDESDTRYLVMEYLEGQTLSERLRAGPLSPREVLEVGVAVASAVDAAHKLGVVHRDLKPSNVMLGPAGIKVLDFGLAKSLHPGSTSGDSAIATNWFTGGESQTASGTVAGTLPYMAPEQLEGKEPDPRSDIWAIGCILYTAATGSRPFQGDSNAALVHAIMGAGPPLLDKLSSTYTPQFARIVRRCLEKDPQARYASAADLLTELRGTQARIEEIQGSADIESPTQTIAATDVSALVGGSPKRRYFLIGVVASLALAAIVVGYFQLRPDSGPSIAVDGAAVAVLPFENLTGDDQLGFVASGLAADLSVRLAGRPGLKVVGRSQVRRANEYAQGTAQLAEELGVNYFVEGQVQRSGDKLRADVSVVDVLDGRVLWSDRFESTQDEIAELQVELVRAVSRVLAVPLSAKERRGLMRSAHSSKAFNYYLQGIERLEQRGNPRHLEYAVDLFRQATRIEDNVAAFHAALSNAISQRYLDGETFTATDSTEAETEARKALSLDPQFTEGSIALARALRMQGRHAESIAELRPVLAKHPKADEAFIELSFGYELAGDREAAFEALESAVALGPDNWFNWNALGVTQVERGEFEVGMESLEKAVRLAPAGVIWPRMNLGTAKLAQGDNAGAIEEYESAGTVTPNADLASNIATAYFNLGEFEKSVKTYRKAVSLAPDKHTMHRNLGDALLASGNRAGAMDAYSVALRLAEEELIDAPKQGLALLGRALYSAKLGRCDQAIEHLRESTPYVEELWYRVLEQAMTNALCGRDAEAIRTIERVLELGGQRNFVRAQPEFQGLADNAAFVALVADSD